MNLKQTTKKSPQAFKPLIALTALLLLQACQTTAKPKPAVIAVNDNRCEVDALAMAEHASSTASSSQFLSSANQLQQCADSYTRGQNNKSEEAMRLMAASTFNYIKGGDVQRAKQQLNTFTSQFPRQDLYFSDYTSFLDTATALLDSSSLTFDEFSKLNINPRLRGEIKRKQYWQSH
ncbi:hypothetical protein QX776_03240 [Alteromonadaceae bacterium BrNp21-10]|nr:hypothetical protein [Alteromonadaceae bacterium BrNp21-10]